MVVDTSGHATMASSYELYRYTPSLAAAVLFIILFILITVYHAYQMAQARAWYFTCFILGGIC